MVSDVQRKRRTDPTIILNSLLPISVSGWLAYLVLKTLGEKNHSFSNHASNSNVLASFFLAPRTRKEKKKSVLWKSSVFFLLLLFFWGEAGTFPKPSRQPESVALVGLYILLASLSGRIKRALRMMIISSTLTQFSRSSSRPCGGR